MKAVNLRTIIKKIGEAVLSPKCFLACVVCLGIGQLCGLAQDGHSHTSTQQQQEQTPEQKNNGNALIKIVRDSTERFKNVAAAQAEGYALQFGCVSGSDSGAMGLHYVNGALVSRG